MAKIAQFLCRTRNPGRRDWTDWLTYGYLVLGIVLMFGPVVWLVLSSFKTDAELQRFPPRLLPYAQQMIELPGREAPLPAYRGISGEIDGQAFGMVRRVGLTAQVVSADAPQTIQRIPFKALAPIEEIKFETGNYTELFERFNFPL